MLHRLALRVIPQLNAAVTERDVRKRKRLVMLGPGFIAFLLYRLSKDVLPFGDPYALLTFSGTICTIAALWAYRMGRRESLVHVMQCDSFNRIAWIVGWVGFIYGLQLSLLVLALLALFVGYNFLLHPEGPAMMALIISATAVTRDSFEIGHVTRLEIEGSRMVTFPDGQSLRELLQRDPLHVGQWVAGGLVGGGLFALLFGVAGHWGMNGVAQAVLAMVVAGSLAHCAFLHGKYPEDIWSKRFKSQSWWERIQFWMWPCLTFALTYYLVLWGFVVFLLNLDTASIGLLSGLAGVVCALMVGYSYFLGTRVFVEIQTEEGISEGLRRCPFVMEILAKTGWVSSVQVPTSSSLATESVKRTS
jgi:hypothetical protein